MKTAMLPETQTQWPDLGKLLIYIAPPFVLAWKFITMYFKERSEQRSDFIKVIVKEVMEATIEPIKTQITRLEEHTQRGFEQVHKRIDDLKDK